MVGKMGPTGCRTPNSSPEFAADGTLPVTTLVLVCVLANTLPLFRKKPLLDAEL